ncbi:MAG: hypothetical protein HYT87_03605 [Nitrospirae bacterium]|nr:hypothetical protein [Nitrospirota bacterium]
MPILIFAYNVLWGLALVLLLPAWCFAALFSSKLRKELVGRFDVLRTLDPGSLDLQAGGFWVHAASVGEVVTVMPLLRQLEARGRACSLLTTSTLRGSEMGRRESRGRFPSLVLPPDLYPLVRLLFAAARPKALILVNSEFWLNLIYLAHVRRVPVLLVNGKLSERSFRSFMRFRFLLAPIFLVPRLYLVRTVEDRDRFCALGVPAERVHVVGSLRFAAAVQRVRQGSPDSSPLAWLSTHKFVIGGSTRAGEEPVLLDAFAKLRKSFDDLKLMIVPRELERVGEIVRMATDRGFEPVRASGLMEAAGSAPPSWTAPVLIWDRFGELAHLYPHARLAFVGASLVNLGGHNPLESALWGVPTLFGPSRFNVVEECQFAESRGLGYVIRNADEMSSTAERLLRAGNGRPANDSYRLLEDAEAHAESLERTLEKLRAYLPA